MADKTTTLIVPEYLGPLPEQSLLSGVKGIAKTGLERLTEIPAWASPEYQERAKQYGEIRAPEPWYKPSQFGPLAAEAMIPLPPLVGLVPKLKGLIAPITKNQIAVNKMYDEAYDAFRLKNRNAPNSIVKALRHAFVDVSGNVKKELLNKTNLGKQAVMYHDLIAGSGARSARQYDDASKKIFKGLSSGESELFGRLIESRRTIAIESYKKGIAHPKGFKSAEHQEWLEAINPKTKKMLDNRADEYFNVMREQLRNLMDEGLITEESYSAMRGVEYSPRRFMQYIDPDITYTKGARKITVPDSGIKPLKEGSEELLVHDPKFLMSQVISRTQQRISKNRANKALLDLAENVPDNGIVTKAKYQYRLAKNQPKLLHYAASPEEAKIIEKQGYLQGKLDFIPNIHIAKIDAEKTGGKVFSIKASDLRVKKPMQLFKPRLAIASKPPPTHQTISAMVDGKRTDMWMPNDMAREWIERDPVINHQVLNGISWLSGNKILKAMATGYNPEFALTNFPRDIAHVWLASDQYSKHLPKYPFEIGRDLLAVTKDAFLRKGRFLDYVNEGGGMEFLTQQGSIEKIKTGPLKNVGDVLGYLGETSEILTRLALRERAIRNGKDATEATWIARNYMDFYQGGNVSKMLDSALPYFNAAIQGTRGIVRQAGKTPGRFTYQAAQIGTLSSGLYYANRFQNPEAWEQISDREKVSNWIITTGRSYVDKKGNRRHIYFRIPKDQGQRAIASIFEGMSAKAIGEDVDIDQVRQSVADFLPIVPPDILPPAFDAILGYMVNKDFWRNEDIWESRQYKVGDIDSAAEFTPWTHPAYKQLGQVTGLSPERTRYALQQFFTSGNIYTSLVGHSWNVLTRDMSKKEKDQVTQQTILSQPFIRKVMRSTNPLDIHKDVIDKARKQSNTEKHLMNVQFDNLSQDFYDGKVSNKDMVDFYKMVPREERDRLKIRHKRRGRLKDIPNKRFWLNLADLPPEARANVFYSVYAGSTPEERKTLSKVSRKFPGIRSKRFRRQFMQLKRKGTDIDVKPKTIRIKKKIVPIRVK
jgi:hypothetical protein